jgi:hypothetical protein
MPKKQQGKCERMFSSFDITGSEVLHFTYRGSVDHKTMFGGIGSIIAILILVAYATQLLVLFWRKPYFTVDVDD